MNSGKGVKSSKLDLYKINTVKILIFLIEMFEFKKRIKQRSEIVLFSNFLKCSNSLSDFITKLIRNKESKNGKTCVFYFLLFSSFEKIYFFIQNYDKSLRRTAAVKLENRVLGIKFKDLSPVTPSL